MAESKRRSSRGTENSSARRGSGRRKTKKQKVNLLPVAAAAILLLLIVVFSNAVMRSKPAEEGETNQQGVLFFNQPEFFSTIKPESLNMAEVDTADDMDKAAAYFKNSLFVGDSQMDRIQNAKLESERVGAMLSEALFMTAEEYTWSSMAGEFSGGALTFNLYGDYVSLTGAIEKTGVEKVFLQFGRMDLAVGDVSAALLDAQTALRSLKLVAPQTEIIVLALTPNTAESTAAPNNDMIRAFNDGMKDLCSGMGIVFADTAAAFPTEGLPAEYCMDPEGQGIHLNTDGSVVWANALLEIVSAPQSTPAPAPQQTEAPIAEPTDEPTTAPAENGGTQTAGRGMNAAGRVVS